MANMSRSGRLLIFIIAISILSLYVCLPKKISFDQNIFGKQIKFSHERPNLNLKFGNLSFQRDLELKKGLDIQGGVQVTLKADMSQIEAKDHPTALESARNIISRRVDLYGVSESTVKTVVNGSDYRLVVELPGVTNPEEALKLIGQTANLVFATPVYGQASPGAELQLVNFSPTSLSGNDLQLATVSFENEKRLPSVSIQFKDSGKTKFADMTKQYIGKPIAILLDDQIVTAPVVQTEILDGKAVITGTFTIDEAKTLATQLNAGALPVPISVMAQKNITATLGEASIKQSLIAGAVGLSMVIVFMIGNYGYPGIIAACGLFLYGLFTMALYKLIPVTLTLPGIAGFLLSVGMAVDSNILIFERYKEEIRAGRAPKVALELAFGRAWDSIKDANTATVITGLILFNPLDWNFLNTSGSVRGFALTLILGIFISLFTGIVVTRTLLRLFYKTKPAKL